MTPGTGKAVIAATVALCFSAGMSVAFFSKRPAVLGLQVFSHVSAPAVKQMSQNGQVLLRHSLKGRSQSGGVNYKGAFSSTLSHEYHWYDLIEKKGYVIRFDVDAKDLSTFGEEGDHASLKIVSGPGADVTVTTPHPEQLRLLGLNRDAEITPEMDIPVVLTELCAQELDVSDPIIASLSKNIGEGALARVMEQRKAYLNSTASPVTSRCAAKGTRP